MHINPNKKKSTSSRRIFLILKICVVFIFLYAFCGIYTMFIDEFPFARFMKGEARFKYGTNAIRLDLSNKVVDNLFPVAMYDRVEFNMSTGGNVVVIFLNPIHKELRDAIANIPDPISSYDQLEPLKEGLIISYGTWEMSGLDWVDGYEWSGFKEGRLREQLSPEQIPPSFRKKI